MPEIGVFHLIFLVGDQCVGIDFSLLVPSPRGPRQPGQFSLLGSVGAAGAADVVNRRQVSSTQGSNR